MSDDSDEWDEPVYGPEVAFSATVRCSDVDNDDCDVDSDDTTAQADLVSPAEARAEKRKRAGKQNARAYNKKQHVPFFSFQNRHWAASAESLRVCYGKILQENLVASKLESANMDLVRLGKFSFRVLCERHGLLVKLDGTRLHAHPYKWKHEITIFGLSRLYDIALPPPDKALQWFQNPGSVHAQDWFVLPSRLYWELCWFHGTRPVIPLHLQDYLVVPDLGCGMLMLDDGSVVDLRLSRDEARQLLDDHQRECARRLGSAVGSSSTDAGPSTAAVGSSSADAGHNASQSAAQADDSESEDEELSAALGAALGAA